MTPLLEEVLVGSGTPFHYAGVLTELSQGLQHVHQASDWHEGLGETREQPRDVRVRNERGNLRAAIARLQGAYLALQRHADTLTLEIQPEEDRTLAEQAPQIARTLTEASDAHLPPDLRIERDPE
jgi:hypothetical protein